MKQISRIRLLRILGDLGRGSEKVIGSYLFNGFHIQISKYKQDTNERVKDLYKRRRDKGLCIRCGKKVNKKNPRTNKPYRLCSEHRR